MENSELENYLNSFGSIFQRDILSSFYRYNYCIVNDMRITQISVTRGILINFRKFMQICKNKNTRVIIQSIVIFRYECV